VTAGDLTIAAPEGERYDLADAPADAPSTGRRLAFARHLTDGRHPLVTRALANRFWMHHFGRGVAETPGDFGNLGAAPIHPELLDWLASTLVESGWSLKAFHRTVMTSTAYRQASYRDSHRGEIDPDAALLSRFPIRRLDAESLRDAVLAVAGRLDLTPFGPAVEAVEDGVGLVGPKDDAPRRSVYLQARRSRPISFLTTFDAPVMAVNCERRVDATSAPQALMLMNGEFVLKHAEALAERILAASPGDSSDAAEARVAAAWRAVYLRPPTPEESAAARAFVAAQVSALAQDPNAKDRDRAALADLCQQLFNSNEFLYVD
jgi:hypothetical protein